MVIKRSKCYLHPTGIQTLWLEVLLEIHVNLYLRELFLFLHFLAGKRQQNMFSGKMCGEASSLLQPLFQDFSDCPMFIMLLFLLLILFPSNNKSIWNFSFRRNLNDRETEDQSPLLDVLGNSCTNPSKQFLKFDIQFLYHSNLMFSSLLDVLRN